jgi:hypothetical protein
MEQQAGDEVRVTADEWSRESFFTEKVRKAVYIASQKRSSVTTGYNIRRHYDIKS